MPTTRPLVSDPLRNFKFNIYIPFTDPVTGTQMARLGFMSMSGLGVQIQPLTYREGGDNLTTRKLPGQADVNPITLSRGLFPQDSDNWDWMTIMFTAMYGGSGAPIGTDFRTPIYINILQHPNNTPTASGSGPNAEFTYPDQSAIVQVSILLYSCWVGSLAYSDLDAGANAVAVEQMTINYEGFDMLWGGSSFVSNPVGWGT